MPIKFREEQADYAGSDMIEGGEMKLIKCPICHGTGLMDTLITEGYLDTRECPRCGGEGFIEEPKPTIIEARRTDD